MSGYEIPFQCTFRVSVLIFIVCTHVCFDHFPNGFRYVICVICYSFFSFNFFKWLSFRPHGSILMIILSIRTKDTNKREKCQCLATVPEAPPKRIISQYSLLFQLIAIRTSVSNYGYQPKWEIGTKNKKRKNNVTKQTLHKTRVPNTSPQKKSQWLCHSVCHCCLAYYMALTVYTLTVKMNDTSNIIFYDNQ